MAGPDRESSGGGVNFQCLPDDPEYSMNTGLHAQFSDLVNVYYGAEAGPLSYHLVPCTACETNKRPTKIMIPGKARCPSNEWVQEYVGYVYSAPAQYSDGSPISGNYHRSTYECVDSNIESLNGRAYAGLTLPMIFKVKARCTGDKALAGNCPPFKSHEPLSCVVCSK